MTKLTGDDPITGKEWMNAMEKKGCEIPPDIIQTYFEKLIQEGLEAIYTIPERVPDSSLGGDEHFIDKGGAINDIGEDHQHLLTELRDSHGNLARQNVNPGDQLTIQQTNDLVFQTWQLNAFFEAHPEMHPAELAKLREELESDFLNGNKNDSPELREKNWRYYQLTGKNVLQLPAPVKPMEKKTGRKDTTRNQEALKIAKKLKAENPKMTKGEIYNHPKIKKIWDDDNAKMPKQKYFEDQILKDLYKEPKGT